MRLRVRHLTSLIAIYAIALHAILWGIAPVTTAASVDPFSIICHGGAPGSPSSDIPDRGPSHACDHCNLCSAIAPPDALDAALHDYLAPARILHVLRPFSAAARASLTATPKLARGPPAFA